MARYRNFSEEKLNFFWRWQRGRCYLCAQPMVKKKRSRQPLGKNPTVDHVVPLNHGGSKGRNNTCLAHYDCNLHRDNSHPKPCEIFFAEQAWCAWEGIAA